jgi:hypothetical protein
MLGPKILKHVRCPQCYARYNGRTGRSNTLGVLFYMAVTFLVTFALMLAVFLVYLFVIS